MKNANAQLLDRFTQLCGQVLAVQHELVSLRWMVAATSIPETKKTKKPKRKRRR